MTEKRKVIKDGVAAYKTNGDLKEIHITQDEFYDAVIATHDGHGQLCVMLADEDECVIVPFSKSAAREILDAGLEAEKQKSA